MAILDRNKMAQQASMMPAYDSSDIQKAKQEASVIAAKFQALRESGMFDRPKIGFMDRISNGLLAGGDSLTGTNNYANKMQMQENAYRQQMDMLQQEMKGSVPSSVPIIVMGVDGRPQIVGEAPKGSFVRQSPEALLALAEAKNALPTADMKNAAVTTKQARVLWNEVKAQSEGLKGGYVGIGEIVKSKLNRGYGKSGDYNLYLENLPSSAVALYRSLTGDTRLSDSDAKARALPLLWHPSQDISLRTKKNDFIDKMISSREQLLSSGKYPDGIIPMEDIKSHAKDLDDFQEFNVDGKFYKIPKDKVSAFKEAKGL